MRWDDAAIDAKLSELHDAWSDGLFVVLPPLPNIGIVRDMSIDSRAAEPARIEVTVWWFGTEGPMPVENWHELTVVY